jgi:hypothetical protein
MNQIAIDFLTRCFAPGETIAVLLRRETPAATHQRIVRLESVLTSRYQAWLRYENGLGSNIYVIANPLRSGSRKRTKENIPAIRHLYIDIDVDGDTRLAALRESNLAPIPTAIHCTSPGKYQVLWRVDGFDFKAQEIALKQLAIFFGGDPACTDCNRVLRVPGFLNRKYDPAYRITVEYPCNSVWTPADFRLETVSLDVGQFEYGASLRKQAHKHSKSECDWAWVLEELAQRKDAVELTQKLASNRPDKSNPLYYAQRTVDVASAYLWLLEGVHIGDVIARLESRRSFEISNVLCRARAREVAQTAQHMVSRKKTA